MPRHWFSIDSVDFEPLEHRSSPMAAMASEFRARTGITITSGMVD
jgi:hypothetical protein